MSYELLDNYFTAAAIGAVFLEWNPLQRGRTSL